MKWNPVNASRKSRLPFLMGLLGSMSLVPDAARCGGIEPAPASAIPRVGQWDRFEAAIPNEKACAEPYRDVSLNVAYTRPDGKRIEFWGFYDGGATWKLRLMPDQIGLWRYEARFSDGGSLVEGSFECVPSEIPGMLLADETNPMWFGFKGGRHLLVRSLHAGDCFFAGNWPQAKREAFLDWAGRQGYNMLSVASHYLNRHSAGRGKEWKTPALWPLDAGEYRKLEALLDDLARRRLMVHPFAGFFGQSSNFPIERADQELYIRYTLARLGPYWNILLNVAGPEPLIKAEEFHDAMSESDINRLGALIASLDVFGHPLSIHNPTKTIQQGDPFALKAWLTYSTAQGPKTTDRRKLSQGLLAYRRREIPLLAQETLWPGNKFHKELQTGDDLRKNAYVIMMSAAALNFGDMDGDSSSGFSGTLELDQRVQQRHDLIKQVWDFFETVPFYRMKPRQDLVNNGYCLAEPGREYLVYLETGGSVDVSVQDGPYLVQWVNARNPMDRRLGGETKDGKGLAAPADGGDWLVRLRKPTPRFSINKDNTGTELGGKPFLVAGLRVSNALISDEKTKELVSHLDEFAAYGVNTFSVFFQGSRFGDVRGYREDATLDPVHAARLGRIIEAASERGMVVLVGCLYYGDSKGKCVSWTQPDAERAIANTVRWLKDNGYRNVFVDVNNEHMAPFDDGRLIAAGKAVDADCVIGTGGRDTPPNADLSLHHGRPDIPGKYYIQTEGTLKGGGYWGAYSKREGYYNYINIGVYSDDMKKNMIEYTDGFLGRGQGFLFASTWLQCAPPHGPNHKPGGMGTLDDPGVRWWLEHLKSKTVPKPPSNQTSRP